MNKVYFGHYSRLEQLQGMTLVDLHSHSTYSDGRDPVVKCVKRAKKLGINLCLTDHNAIGGSLYANAESFSIPSIEVTSSDSNDLLLYFYSKNDLVDFYGKYIKGHRITEDAMLNFYRTRWKTEELLQKAKKYNAVIVLPHPDAIPPKKSGVFFDGNPDLLKYIDAVEGINSTMTDEANKKAIYWAKKWKKPMTGCSDAHLSRFIGAGVTAFESTTREGILEDMRKGRNIVVGRNLRFLRKLQSNFNVIKNNLRW